MPTSIKTIPKGYKQTEIGVIPVDWDFQPISRIAKITTGSKNTQDKVDAGLYPFFVRSQVIERINSYSYDGEAILTAGDGVGTGKVFHYINGKFDIHQRVYKISDFSNDINGYYFYLYFSNNFYNRIMQMTAKSSVDSVRMEMIADMQIPLPVKTEQVLIAKALSDIDALIEKTENLIEKKKAIKQGAMQELLTGKRKLPGFGGEWEETGFGNFADINKGQVITSNTRIEGVIPVIAGGKTPAYFHNKANRFGKTITISGSGASAGYVAFHTQSIFASDCSTIEESDNYSIEYVYFYLQLMQEKIYKMQTGGAQPHIHPKDLKPIKITVPCSKEEQTAIATILSDIDTEIEKLESELTKWRGVKRGMMQTLLTGKIRLIK